MQVKVFEAPDMSSGLKLVKDTFGPDALILSTRTVKRGGKLGLMGKSILEITAAIDNQWQEKPVPHPIEPAKRSLLTSPARDPLHDEITYDQIWDAPEPEPAPEIPQRNTDDSAQLKNDIADLKATIEGLTQRISAIQAAKQNRSPVTRKPYIEPEFTQPAATATDQLCTILSSHGVDPATATIVADCAREHIQSDTEIRIDQESALKAAITKMITTEKLLQQKLHRQQRISLIGPTGVGKTTTIAKLAANYLSQFGGKIALFTIDTYRIAAIEQLKVYGEIMRLPVEVIIKPEEVGQALCKYSDYDLILIDTAGRSPHNTTDLQEMGSFLDPSHGIENHLLLASTTRERELAETINRFSILPVRSFIFSKIDECDQLGTIVNIHSKNSTPISFLTNGQRVPEDIIAPNPATIANLIMNDHRNL
ncbi:MAG: flagellar biosynthesis protein FlhF [Desulfobulbus propionicus]|nr:MAG: flagellar biosynthesis protein FlhF [Desulfobulbus propionicus]